MSIFRSNIVVLSTDAEYHLPTYSLTYLYITHGEVTGLLKKQVVCLFVSLSVGPVNAMQVCPTKQSNGYALSSRVKYF